MGLLDRLNTKDRATRDVVIPLSDAAVKAQQKADAKLSRLTIFGNQDDKAKAQTEADEARAELREQSVVITVQALSPDEWEALQREHPPLPEEVEQARKDNGPFANVAWNGKTFLPAAWARCQVVPDGEEPLTAAECETAMKLWGPGEQMALLRAIQEVHQSTISLESLGE